MSSLTVLVTGASRGIGLAYTKELLSQGHAVIAGARSPEGSKELQSLKRQYPGKFELVTLDVANKQSVEVQKACKGFRSTNADRREFIFQDAAGVVSSLPIANKGIDILINNAGVFHGPLFNGILGAEDAVSDLTKTMQVNVYGIIHVTKAFLPLLRKSNKKVIVNISSDAGAFGSGFANVPISCTYSITKAATNMLSVKLHGELAPEGFAVVPIHPGLVQTDMGSSAAKELQDSDLFADSGIQALTPEEAAQQGIAFVLTIKPEHSGRFFSFDGEEKSW
ncbi:hypothetical protein OIV83_004534 [Microbotryomycetes sp. JL201]|nr:hypothetical protein OIV83_004534 [Microbotryomycetes sp. JL201]